jgi:hypothetical protein
MIPTLYIGREGQTDGSTDRGKTVYPRSVERRYNKRIFDT